MICAQAYWTLKICTIKRDICRETFLARGARDRKRQTGWSGWLSSYGVAPYSYASSTAGQLVPPPMWCTSAPPLVQNVRPVLILRDNIIIRTKFGTPDSILEDKKNIAQQNLQNYNLAQSKAKKEECCTSRLECSCQTNNPSECANKARV